MEIGQKGEEDHRLHDGGLPKSLEDVEFDLRLAGHQPEKSRPSRDEQLKELRELRARGISEEQILAVLETDYGHASKLRDPRREADAPEKQRMQIELADKIQKTLRDLVEFLGFLDNRVASRAISHSEALQYRRDIGVVEFKQLAAQAGFRIR